MVLWGTHWISITLGWGMLTIVLWGHTLDQHLDQFITLDQHQHGVEGRLTIVLWGHTLDQHHTGLKLRQVDNSSMGAHTGSASQWVEGDNSSGRLTIVLWGRTLDQHQTELRQVDNTSMGAHTGSATGCLMWYVVPPCLVPHCSGEYVDSTGCGPVVFYLALYHLFYGEYSTDVNIRLSWGRLTILVHTLDLPRVLYRCGPVVPPCLVPPVLESTLQVWSSCATLPCTTCSGEYSTGVVQLCHLALYHLFWRVLYRCGPVVPPCLVPPVLESTLQVWSSCATLPCTTCSGEYSTGVVQLCHLALYHLFWRVLYRCGPVVPPCLVPPVLESTLQMWSSCATLPCTTCSGECSTRCGPVVPPCLVPPVLESALQVWSSCVTLPCTTCSGEYSTGVVQLCHLALVPI